MPLFRLTPPRREALLMSHGRDPAHPGADDLELSLADVDLARAAPTRGARLHLPAALADDALPGLEALGFRRCPAACAQWLDLAPFETPAQYEASGPLTRRARERLKRALRAFEHGGGRVDVAPLAALDAASLGRLYAELLPFSMSRSINPYFTAYTPRFLEFVATQAGVHLGEALLLRLVAGDRTLGCLLGRLASAAEHRGLVAQNRAAGASTELALRWERPLADDDAVFEVVLAASTAAPDASASLRAELQRLLWWHGLAWAIAQRATIFSGGVDLVDAPFVGDELLNVVVAKRQLGMTTATFWATDGLLWRPDRGAFFMARASALCPYLTSETLGLELLVASDPTGLAGALATSDAHVPARRVYVATRRDAEAVRQMCARAGREVEVRVWGAAREGAPCSP